MRRTFIFAILVVPTVVYLHKHHDSLAELTNNVRVEELKERFQTQSADALLKMRALRTAIEESVREHNFSRESFWKWSSELYNLSLERASELKAFLENNGHKVYSLGSERASELKSYCQSHGHKLYTLSLERASELKAYLQSDQPAAALASMLQWLQKDQPASAIAAVRTLQGKQVAFGFALLAATTVLLSFFRILCCRRRRVSATLRQAATVTEGGAPAGIMRAPTPMRSGFDLRERQPLPPQPLQSRRRSDTPRATAADENTAPASGYLLHKLNHDSVEDLVAINGLGDKSAAKIVNWRNKNGPLKNVDDLAKCGLSNIVLTNLRRSQLHN